MLFEDITEEKEAHENLRESEEKYKQLFDTMSEMFQVIELIYDENGRAIDYYYRQVNPAFEKLVGKTQDQLIDKCVKDIFGIVEDYWINAYEQVDKTGIPIRYENYGEELDKYYAIKAWPIENKRIGIVFSDFTEQKRAEDQRKQIEDTLLETEIINRSILEGSPVCNKIIDLDSRLQYMSSSEIERLKIPDIKPYYGQIYPPKFYPEAMRAPLVNSLDQAMVGKISSVECPVHDLEGNEVWYHTTYVPAFDDDGQVRFVIGSSVDVTARVEAEQELQQANITLEERVSERTEELSTLVDAMAGREVRMAELKSVITKLRKQLKDNGINPIAYDPLLGPDDEWKWELYFFWRIYLNSFC
jgi:PAS domain S-box-containing protein